MLDFRIDTFLAVCRHMNYTKAAEELHITQPAVSQHIRFLENYYDAKLFTLEGKKIQLTSSGELLLLNAIALKNDEKLLIDRIKNNSVVEIPPVFGVTRTIGEYIISEPLSRYMHSHPDTQVKMVIDNTADLLQKLRLGEINFALVEGYFPADEYDYLTYSMEDFIAVCSQKYVFAKEPVQLCDLLSERLLVRESGSGTRDILEKNLTVKNMSVRDFKTIAEISSMHTIVQLVMRDCGISFMYRAAVERELNNGSLREIKLSDFHMRHEFTFIWNKGSIYSEDYKKICMELRQING